MHQPLSRSASAPNLHALSQAARPSQGPLGQLGPYQVAKADARRADEAPSFSAVHAAGDALAPQAAAPQGASHLAARSAEGAADLRKASAVPQEADAGNDNIEEDFGEPADAPVPILVRREATPDVDAGPVAVKSYLNTLEEFAEKINGPRGPSSAEERRAEAHTLGRSCGMDASILPGSRRLFLRKMLRHAPMGEGLRQRISFEKGYREASRQRVEGTANEHRQAVRTKNQQALTRFTSLTQWHGTHALAGGSSHPIENPALHRMRWATKHNAFWGATHCAEKSKFALAHAQAHVERHDGEPADMRPLMHAGLELALRNGGEHIRPEQAKALVDAVIAQSRDLDHGSPMSPDHLRMFVAGMVAVWNPVVSNAVALHLLDLELAAPASSEGDAGATSQRQAVAQGFGIGMGWKGMSLVRHSFEQLPDGKGSSDRAKALLGEISEGQSGGKIWLSRLEAALPELQGRAPDDLAAPLDAVILLRKHHETGDSPQAAASTEKSNGPGNGTIATGDDDDDTDTVEGATRVHSTQDEDEETLDLQAPAAHKAQATDELETWQRQPQHPLQVDDPADGLPPDDTAAAPPEGPPSDLNAPRR